jgi:hypothetical protein
MVTAPLESIITFIYVYIYIQKLYFLILDLSLNLSIKTKGKRHWAGFSPPNTINFEQNPTFTPRVPTFLSPSRRTKQERQSMKFAVKAWSNGRARSGVLQLGGCPSPIETPSLLLSTRKGLPFFISPDLLPSLPSPDSHVLQVCPFHL